MARLPASAARPAGRPPPPPGVETYDVSVYRVDNVVSREDRTAIAQTGAAIDEIGANYVIVSATPQEASADRRARLPHPGDDVSPWTFHPPTRPITTMPK